MTGNSNSLHNIVGISTRLRFLGSNSYRNNQYCLLQNVDTSSGVHPASYSIVVGVNFPEVKRPGRDANHLHTSNAELKYEWSRVPNYVI